MSVYTEMSAHDFMKVTAAVPFETLRLSVLNRNNKDGNKQSSFRRRFSLRPAIPNETRHVVQRIDIENLLTKSNNVIESSRFYIQSTESPEYNSIGWILHDSVTNCMFCGTFFGAMQAKHNCSACGLVACGACASNYAYIAELDDEKKHRVCKNCYTKTGKVKAREKFKYAPRGRVSQSIVPLLPQSPTAESVTSNNIDETESQQSESVSADSINAHYRVMKDIANKPLHEVKLEFKRSQDGYAITRRASIVGSSSQRCVFTISDIVEEPLVLSDGKTVAVHRVYVRSNTGGQYSDLGWIIKDEASNCMECMKPFGALRSKYHCKSCGDLICNSCSPHQRKIAELGIQSSHRVCNRCHNGALASDIMHIRLRRPSSTQRQLPLSNDESSHSSNDIETQEGQDRTSSKIAVETSVHAIFREVSNDPDPILLNPAESPSHHNNHVSLTSYKPESVESTSFAQHMDSSPPTEPANSPSRRSEEILHTTHPLDSTIRTLDTGVDHSALPLYLDPTIEGSEALNHKTSSEVEDAKEEMPENGNTSDDLFISETPATNVFCYCLF